MLFRSYRSYFRTAWKAKPPSWTLGGKPAGAGGDYPVAYWRPEWKDILVGNDGLVPKIARAGFDGAYLDWIAGYWDSAVIARAHADGVDPRAEMLLLLRQVATAARAINPQFLLVVQNAPELADSSDVVELTDAFAQESMWFAGAEGDSPSGDCPMSRTNKELGSPTYLARLSGPCKRARDEGRAEVLNYAQQAEVVPLLSRARSRGLAVFTVDYALRAENIAEASRQSRALGFRPFVGAHGLKKFVNPQF